MTSRKKQVNALGGTVGIGGQASGERFAEITSGTSGWQQGLSGNLHRLLERGYKPRTGEATGWTHEPVGATTVG
jgi:hypothetical protein